MHTVPDNEHKPARGQIKGPHDYSPAAQSAVASTLTSTRDQGVDPNTICLDSSTEVDLSHTKATLISQTDEAAYLSAQTMLSGPNSSYLTADNGMRSCNPCASSFRKKEQETTHLMDVSIQATQGSDDAARDPEPKEDAGVILAEQ